MAAPEK
ncbi:Protein of unknown function [Escherichia coli]|nr:Protein of unknown function [Escherichia coli D6-113.11]CDP73693.1 Protein of unknown function [Escherichia coli]CDU33482.1 Protein of unknown function [Escherichia coli D6-113.11]CDU40884.1 Protein of unknown function [Escherichia coli]